MTSAALASLAPSTSALAASRPRRAWTVVLAILSLLAYFLWAGSSYDPRRAALWTFTQAVKRAPGISEWRLRWSGGWFVPAPGLGHLFLAAAMLFAALSILAYRTLPAAVAPLETPERRAFLWRMITAAVVFVIAVGVYLVVLGAWQPLVLDRTLAAARVFAPPVVARIPAILAALFTVIAIFLALATQGRSLWMAALFALHPLVIIEAVSNGSPIAYFLPLLVFLAMGWRFQRYLRITLILAAAAGCVAWVAHLALNAPPFNGLIARCLTLASIESTTKIVALIALETALQALIVVLSLRGGWPLARTLGHMLVAWAIVSPRVLPADLLPLLALIPLAWNRAGWVLSATILLTYALFPLTPYSPRPGVPFTSPWQIPSWLIFVTLTPALVVEVEELLSLVLPSARSSAKPGVKAV